MTATIPNIDADEGLLIVSSHPYSVLAAPELIGQVQALRPRALQHPAPASCISRFDEQSSNAR